MKNFKQCILAISLCLLSWSTSQACGWDGDDPSYYDLFHCTQALPNLEEQHIDESTLFWARYAGLPADETLKNDIRSLRLSDFDDETSDNLLLKTLRTRQQNDALTLLRLNCELSELVESRFEWSYRKVTPEDYQRLLAQVNDLEVNHHLTKRKTFLKMRILARLNADDAMLQLWNSEAKDWEPSEVRDRMEGYVASIHFRRGDYDQALPIYFRLRDGGSIGLCVNRMLDATSIEEVYQKDPNAMILGYILEDYANYFYHAKEHQEYWKLDEKDYDIWTKVTRQRDNVMSLAQKVVDEGKARDLQMWQTFIGFMQMINGQNDLAYHNFVKADSLPGQSVAGRLIRHYKLTSALAMDDKPAHFDKYVSQELRYYKEIAQYLDQPERDVLNNLYDHETKYRLYNYIDQRGDPTLTFLTHTALEPGAFWEMDHEMTTQQVKEVQAYVKHGGDGDLGQCLVRYCNIPDDQFNEMIGTKLIREGRYEEAKDHLEKVSDSYLRSLGIAPYLMKRQLPERPFERKVRTWYDEPWSGEIDNVKLQFCLQVLGLKEWLSEAQGEKKAEVALTLANMLYQASPSGDLWALSEYSWSSYGSHRNAMNDQSINCLKLALDVTNDYDTKVKCHYGLAANPCCEEDATVVYDWEKKRHYLEPEGSQREAYLWLHYQTKRDNPIFKTCDWLKLYIVGND